MAENDPQLNAAQVAERLARTLNECGQEYALGGAIALGYWADPRGTIDVDLTLFLPAEKPSECIWLLQEIGCDVVVTEVVASIEQHGFCRASYRGLRVDVFLPIVPFYELARARRRQVKLGETPVSIWDADSLAVFKMMFFRRKDLADVEQILRVQGDALDRGWIRQQLEEIYGARDPRVGQWDELVAELEE